MGERVAIIGSRDFPDLDLVREYVCALPPCTRVVSGGARGVDRTAERWAKRRHMDMTLYKAEWSTQGKKAGPIRNKLIVDNCDRVVAFWDGKSKGTAHAIELARKYDKPLTVIGPRSNGGG